MSNENKNALLNAGFGGNFDPVFRINNDKYTIYADQIDLSFSIYENANGTTYRKVLDGYPRDIAELKEMCSKYLDFFPKKYDWETIKEGLTPERINALRDLVSCFAKAMNIGLVTESEALSQIAQLKLNLIIKEIDKEFPKQLHNMTGIINMEDEELKAQHIQDFQAINYRINTATQLGAEKLLETNPELLNQLFKIKIDV